MSRNRIPCLTLLKFFTVILLRTKGSYLFRDDVVYDKPVVLSEHRIELPNRSINDIDDILRDVVGKDNDDLSNNVESAVRDVIKSNISEEHESPELNYRPIIGILAQELSRSLEEWYGDNYTSYIGAAYVKYIEAAGARVVPVLINQTNEYYEMIFNSTNGLLIPGGAVSLSDSGKILSNIRNIQCANNTFVHA